MDISYINSVSRELDWFAEYPCCKASKDIDFDPLPSSLAYADLVDALPCYNPSNEPGYLPHDSLGGLYQARANYDCFTQSRPLRAFQRQALDTFELIHSTVARTLGRDGVSIVDIKQYAACFDKFLFDGKLLARCSIEWTKDLKPSERLGQTGYNHICYSHQQCHTVRILLTRYHHGADGKRLSPRKQLDYILSILLHEMSHAWVEIFGNRKYGSASEAIEEIGPTGHGKAWKNVFRMCVWAAREHFGLECDREDEAFEDNDDAQVVRTVERLANVATGPLSHEYLLDRISTELKIPTEHANMFTRLVEKGLEEIEALLTVWGSSLVMLTKPGANVHEIMPIDWHWK
ncbi:MAG: hypothetical protein Q9195_004878 [Heterodermia aff. obscurata]